MRLQQLAFVAVLAVSVPAAVTAQTTSGTTTVPDPQGSTIQVDQPAPTPADQTPPTTSTQTTSTQTTTTQTQTTTYQEADHPPNRWIASGLIGSNYSNNSAQMAGGVNSSSALSSSVGGVSVDTSDDASLDFGLSVGYLWRSIVGAEFMAGFTPDFNLANTFVASGSSPQVNTYMVNAVGAFPLGQDGRFQPYVSGGFGGITLSGATAASGLSPIGSTTGNNNAVSELFESDESRAGSDIGAGIMAFAGAWGLRGDIRYFRAFESDDTTVSTTTSADDNGTTTTVSGLLPGLDFWRANIGVAFRW